MVTFRRQNSVSQIDGGCRSAASTFAVFCAGGSPRGSSAVETDGASLGVAGAVVELTGKTSEVVVPAIETTRLGAIVEFFGIALAVGCAAPHIADASFEIADASLFHAADGVVDASSSSDQPERIARSIVPHMYVLAVRFMSYNPNHTLVPSLLLIYPI